jgi:putative hemolysin
MLYLELLLVAGLVLLNGVLSMSELAVVSSRPGRLKAMAERGVAGARTALDLAEEPGKFLSAVQVGITLVGILAGAFSGASLGGRLSDFMIAMGAEPAYAEPIGFALVITAITYFSLIIGELVPKQLALRNPEGVACKVAYPMALLAKAVTPFVWILDGSGRMLIRLLGLEEKSDSTVTDEEIRTLIAEAESAGVIESGERTMIAGVMRLGDKPVKALMTPLTDIDMLAIDAAPAELRRKIAASPHSRIPVHGEDPEVILGILQIKDAVDALLRRRKLNLTELIRTVPVIPESMPALDAMELFRDSSIHMAFVQDEYGRTLGIVTAADLLGAIAGLSPAEAGAGDEDDRPVQRDDGSWLLPGGMAVDEMAELIRMTLPEKRGYDTVAGLIVEHLKHLPSLGQSVTVGRWRFEVIDLDGRRVDKVLASPVAKTHRPRAAVRAG